MIENKEQKAKREKAERPGREARAAQYAKNQEAKDIWKQNQMKNKKGNSGE